MKLFKTSRGIVLSYGYDPLERKEDFNRICWSDIDGKFKEAAPDNQAGWMVLNDRHIAPEFIFEINDRIVAYQPGICIELTYLGLPIVWGVKVMFPDNSRQAVR